MLRFLFLLIPVVILSCQSPEAPLPVGFTEEEKQAVKDSVLLMLDNYNKAVNEKGLTGEFAYLDSSDDFFWVPPGYVVPISYDSVASYIRQNAPIFRKIVNMWDSIRVIPLSGELAVYTGRLRSTMTDTAGMITNNFIIETGTIIKRADGWKLLSGQSALLP